MSSSAQMAPSPPRIQKMLKPRSASTEAMRRVAGTGATSMKLLGANCNCMRDAPIGTADILPQKL